MNRLITSVVFGLAAINTLVMADTTRPRLVVGIVVDQLRTDYLEYLRSLFGEDGFNRLMDKGVYMRDVDFRRTVADPASATAVVFSGGWPAANGVVADRVFDHSSKRSVPALADNAVNGNFTTEAYSPALLRLSTISDELAIDGGGLGLVYSISADPQQAVVMSGHAGNSAVWICDNNGKWASSTYYKDFPASLSRVNSYNPLSRRLDTLQWKPSRELSEYPGVPAQKRYYPFRYTFPTGDRDVYRRFKLSAPANTEVTDAAISCLESLSLGKRGDAIDMLNVGYTAAPFKYIKDGDYRLELEDTYLRLDSQIGRLFDAIDRQVGLDNTVIFLTSTGYYDDATADAPAYRIPSGDFSLKRAESLLNSYLSAKHGNGDYVETILDGEVFLDRRTIEEMRLSASMVREEAREFLLRMSGVAEAYTLDEIPAGGNETLETLRLLTDPKTSGDIFISFVPGWNVVSDNTYPVTTRAVRYGRPLTPAFLMGPEIKAVEINTPVDATVIAPTVTSALHIRSPNGARQKALAF